MANDPTVTIRLCSDADCVPHYTWLSDADYTARDPAEVINRKRDLDVLQKLGLGPGDTRRARYLIETLFERIATPWGLCAFDTPGWEGCEFARSGAHERAPRDGASWSTAAPTPSGGVPSGSVLATPRATALRAPAPSDVPGLLVSRREAEGLRPNDTLAEISGPHPGRAGGADHAGGGAVLGL